VARDWAKSTLARAAESVTPAQRQRIARSAEVYIQRHAGLMDCDIRFDVMVLTGGWLPQRITDAWRP